MAAKKKETPATPTSTERTLARVLDVLEKLYDEVRDLREQQSELVDKISNLEAGGQGFQVYQE